MWTYQIAAKSMSHDGQIEGFGYSGHGEGLDNPAMCNVQGVGPIPPGKYTIGPWHDEAHLGPCVAHLEPDPANEMYGRSEFYIHGDNSAADHSASDGCIILGPSIRHAMRDSRDTELTVTP